MISDVQPNYEYVKVCCRRLYDAQKMRIQQSHRMERLYRDKIVIKEKAEKDFSAALKHDLAAEKEYERIVYDQVKELPVIADWAIRVKGIGPRYSGLCVALLAPIERFANVAKVWAYAGLHTVGGRSVRRTPGEKIRYSPELRMTAWKIGTQFVRTKGGGPYRDVYDRYKQRIIDRELTRGSVIWHQLKAGASWTAFILPEGTATPEPIPYKARKGKNQPDKNDPTKPEWTTGRINAMSVRYIAKLFLSHLWKVWREAEGLPTREPYAIEYLGHTTKLDPWDFVEPEKPRRKRTGTR